MSSYNTLKFSFEPKSTFWIEFERKKSKAKKAKPARKALSAQHRQAISEGLLEHYESIPKKIQQETTADRVDKASKAIGRLTRSAKTLVETANLADALWANYKHRNSRLGKAERVLGTAGMGIGVASGAVGIVGSALRSTQIATDLASGSKRKQLELRQQALDIKKQANKTNRQVHAVRAKLERQRMKRKDAELAIKATSGKAYGRLVDSAVSSNLPGGTKFEEMLTRRSKLEDSGGIKNSLKDILSRRGSG